MTTWIHYYSKTPQQDKYQVYLESEDGVKGPHQVPPDQLQEWLESQQIGEKTKTQIELNLRPLGTSRIGKSIEQELINGKLRVDECKKNDNENYTIVLKGNGDEIVYPNASKELMEYIAKTVPF